MDLGRGDINSSRTNRMAYWLSSAYVCQHVTLASFLVMSSVGASYILQAIKTDMQILGRGGSTSVITKPLGSSALFSLLPVVASDFRVFFIAFLYSASMCFALFLFSLHQILCHWKVISSANNELKKEEEMHQEASQYKQTIKDIWKLENAKETAKEVNSFAKNKKKLLEDLD